MKRLFVALSLLAAGAWPIGCERVVQPKFETVVVDTVATRYGIPCRFQYAFVSIKNADRSPALTAIEEANVAYFFNTDGVDNLHRTIDRSIEEFMGSLDGLDALSRDNIAEMWLTTESEAHVVDSLLVYAITASRDTGGAHAMSEFECHNYSLRGGYELMLADLFDATQQEELQRLIRQKLYDKFNVASDEELVNLGFFPEDIGVVENFEVTENGLTFHYNPYDIAAFAVGAISVEISNQELERL